MDSDTQGTLRINTPSVIQILRTEPVRLRPAPPSLTNNTTNTIMNIHIIPTDDEGKHVSNANCACKPEEKNSGIYTHNIIGKGPDQWCLRLEGQEVTP